jgi:hypothetical protein
MVQNAETSAHERTVSYRVEPTPTFSIPTSSVSNYLSSRVIDYQALGFTGRVVGLYKCPHLSNLHVIRIGAVTSECVVIRDCGF